MKARDDVQIPAGPAVRIWVTTHNVPPAAVIIGTATGSDLGGLLLCENGDCPFGFRRVILGRPRGDETIT